jgi:hypothetical protein
MKATIINVVSIICAVNTIVLTYLTYLYFRKKDDTLQDDGATDTDQKD